jgi:TRAP-type C4-dicarboxylate transport system permease small subunit
MKELYVRWMVRLYWLAVWIAGVSVVGMTLAIPYGVFTRYVLNSASSWPEPLSVLLMVVFTFFGAAACYRANVHIAVALFKDMLPAKGQVALRYVVDGIMILIAGFMVIWGFQLVAETWNQTIAEFPWLPVGVTYLPLPLGSIITILFVIEYIWSGPAKDLAEAPELTEAGAELN